MKIKWLGQAAFLITSDSGVRIIMDPYTAGAPLNYREIKEAADIVTVSHDHSDHSNVAAVAGNPTVVKETTEVKGIKFQGMETYHDDAGGGERGTNTVFRFEVDGVKVCHLGDLGHPLTGNQVAEIGKVDVLLTPVGGNYTIDAYGATIAASRLMPQVVIPMHYNNERCPDFPVASVDEFLKRKPRVVRLDSSEVELKQGELPAVMQITVLKPAL